MFPLQQLFYTKRYYVLLASLGCLTFLAPLVDHGAIARILVTALISTSLLSATEAVRRNSRFNFPFLTYAGMAALIWTTAFCVNSFPFNTLAFQLISHALVLFFFANIARIMLKDVLSGGVNSNRICGALCVYIMIGFCFSMIHMMVGIIDSSAYRDNSHPGEATSDRREAYPLFVYYSFCTLSTVGYGDVVPVTRLARSTSALESLVGQLYLATLIARLVGLHIAESSLNVDSKIEPALSERRKELESAKRKEVALR